MIIKPTFFDLLNRRPGNFESFVFSSRVARDFLVYRDIVVPMDYGDAEAEYRAVRAGCGLFDACMSTILRVTGEDAGALLDRVATRPIGALPPGRVAYVLVCKADGTVADDATVFKVAHDNYLVMPTRIATAETIRRLTEEHGLAAEVTDVSQRLVGLFFQGPASAAVMREIGLDGVEALKRFEFATMELGTHRIMVARVGYTGGLGYECWFEPGAASSISRGVAACRAAGHDLPGYGITAMQACRLEAGLLAPGREFDPDSGMARTPFDLGLGWMVHNDDRDYVGKAALMGARDQQPAFGIRSFSVDGDRRDITGAEIAIPRPGGSIPIGRVTSSAWSPGLERMIGLATIAGAYLNETQATLVACSERHRIELTAGALFDAGRTAQP